MAAIIWSKSLVEPYPTRYDKLTVPSCRCGASFCYICGRSRDEDEACTCAEDVTPTYRLYRPSNSPEPSDQASDQASEEGSDDRGPAYRIFRPTLEAENQEIHW